MKEKWRCTWAKRDVAAPLLHTSICMYRYALCYDVHYDRHQKVGSVGKTWICVALCWRWLTEPSCPSPKSISNNIPYHPMHPTDGSGENNHSLDCPTASAAVSSDTLSGSERLVSLSSGQPSPPLQLSPHRFYHMRKFPLVFNFFFFPHLCMYVPVQ